MSGMTPQERFWEKVKVSDGCWIWTAATNGHGYGNFYLNGSYVGAHRFSWELENGPIKEGFFVCHHCDNRLCVNPKHLFLGTQKDNVHDMIKKGRKNQTRGTEHAVAKLCENDVWLIRNCNLSCRKMARFFGVHHSTISNIRRRKKWNHVH